MYSRTEGISGVTEDVLPKDLFVRLARYQPTENQTPLENFFTEALAYTLEVCGPFRDEFLREIAGVEPGEGACTISTQVYLGNPRPDMLIEIGSKKIYFEHKIRAELNQYEDVNGELIDQVTRYADAVPDEELATTKIKLITLLPQKMERYQRSGLAFDPDKDWKRWPDVYELARKVQNSHGCSPTGRLLLDNILLLMEENDMRPLEGIGTEIKRMSEIRQDLEKDLKALSDFLDDRFDRLLDEILQKSARKGRKCPKADFYISRTVGLNGSNKITVALFRNQKSFLKLLVWLAPDEWNQLDETTLSDAEKRGYRRDKDRYLCKRQQLTLGGGREGAEKQIAEGAEFLGSECAWWEQAFTSNDHDSAD